MPDFEMARRISLNHDEQFFVGRREFKVRVEDVCGTYEGNAFVLDPDMKDAFAGVTSIQASLTEIAHAALQYFQTTAFGKPLDHEDVVFLLTHEFGRAFVQRHARTRRGPALFLAMGELRTTGRHSEANKRTVEMFGYGLALTCVSKALRVPTDLFDFITEANFSTTPTGPARRLSQADFRLDLKPLSLEQLASLHPILVTFNEKGQRVYIEVKSYSGWRSFHEDGQDGKALLANLAAKSAAHTDGCYIAVLVGLPKPSDSPRRNPEIMVADPNSPDPVPSDARLVFVLKRYLFHSLRYGLWKTCDDIVRWLNDLNALDSAERAEFDSARGSSSADIQRNLLRKEFEGKTFRGRIFIELLIRLGPRGQRGLTRQEVEAAVRNQDAGQQYFAGIDTALEELLAQPQGKRMPDEVLAFGVGKRFGTDLVNMSAFIMRPLNRSDEDNQAALRELESALERW